ncbi:Flp family type IVb pilin [Terrarubrum flagellatum]|uniref:Flp family type IVb pilin n=1 Tax=Terrirubrum flagellatum TaxID=2895980 RepID=UPI003144E3C8
MFKRFLTDEAGATALEEALVTAFVALALLGVAGVGGKKLIAVFLEAAEQLGGGSGGTPPTK